MNHKVLTRLKAAFFPLMLGGIVGVGLWQGEAILAFFGNREALRAWVDSKGPYSPLVFIGIQIFQVVVFIIPGEITQAAGGFLFGFAEGALLSLAGILLGSAANYALGKALGRPFVRAVLGEHGIERAEATLRNRKKEMGYFLLFLIPGIPKDVLCYFAGMARAPLGTFLAASMAARLPGIIGSSLIGQSAFKGDLRFALGLTALASLAFIFGLLWKKPMEAFIAEKINKS
ncbi:MAG: hypothetical protein FD137_807 [Spirochaetes bacterium]|nr:MAG: hypothetical protein FD137_807 [Spirochaetota bacterium]